MLVFILGITHFDVKRIVKVIHVFGELEGEGKTDGNGFFLDLRTHAWVLFVLGEQGGFRHVVVGAEFGHREVDCSIVLLVEYVITKVLFHDSVGTLRLFIRLGMDGS